jgi:hypothetical protein
MDRMKPTHLAASLILLLSLPTFAHALDLAGQSRTYLSARQSFDGTRYLPLYEYLDLDAQKIGDENVAFQFGGWYRYDTNGNEEYGTRSTGDLQYAYLDIRRSQSNSSLRLGRVLVNEGVAAEQLDGGYARTDLVGGFTVAAYGGLPVETSGDTRSGDSVYGGRIAQGVSGVYTLGVSYLREKNDSKDFRKEEGVDLWLQPFSKMTVQGMSSYNALTKGWMQHQYYVLFGPFADLRLNVEASKVYYKDYFTATTLASAFSFSVLDPNETVTTVGGGADYSITSSFSVGADYKKYDYALANDSAKYYGGRLVYSGQGTAAGIAVHRMDGYTDQLKYDEQRAYIKQKIAMMDITLDGLHVGYKEPINGEKDAWTGTAAAGFSFTPKARLVADVEYAKNPYYTRNVSGMLTLVYSFDVKSETKRTPARRRAPR